ncbi:DUF3311 domain-containing protein [Geobacter argillaceus]|uniref:Uncharacterized protein DUF3311 n=1 Tax=Geobacter argillaceus TaxID=345631 RepID=A0A562VF97_9BACT|nr:DUF3311 domain-containing protein [Geobacter argillaceus]TWJ16570.1 uncharacterized protein DUF3311 [Geobacter argillaceus]
MPPISKNTGAEPVQESLQHPAVHDFRRRSAGKTLNLLLLLPFLGLLWPPLYARSEPQLLGFPFFYWYQFLWVILSAIITGFVYLATHRR